MSKSAQRVMDEALALSEKQRADLAYRLIRSLDGEPEEGVDEAWCAEVTKRLAEVESGKVKLVPWEEAKARIDRTLARRRTSRHRPPQ